MRLQLEIARISQLRNPETVAVRVDIPNLPEYPDDVDLQKNFFTLNESVIY